MKLNIQIPNVRLLPATFGTAVKYHASALKAEESLVSSYPLVVGDSYTVELTLKGASGDEMYFPEAVVTLTRDRNIVATPVLDGRGTVKEMVSWGDVQLSMALSVVSTTADGDYTATEQGVCKQYDVYPYVGVRRLRNLLDESNRLYITSKFLEPFDLDGDTDYGIVVKSYSLLQETQTNRQVVEIQAMSDYDYDLLIKEE